MPSLVCSGTGQDEGHFRRIQCSERATCQAALGNLGVCTNFRQIPRLCTCRAQLNRLLWSASEQRRSSKHVPMVPCARRASHCSRSARDPCSSICKAPGRYTEPGIREKRTSAAPGCASRTGREQTLAVSVGRSSETFSAHTLVHRQNTFDRIRHHHPHDHHAKDLHAVAAHVQHHSIHGDSLSRGDGSIPSFRHLDRRGVGALLKLLLVFVVLGHRLVR